MARGDAREEGALGGRTRAERHGDARNDAAGSNPSMRGAGERAGDCGEELAWAFVDRRDHDSGEIVGGIEQVVLPKRRAGADMVQARAFYSTRISRGISLKQVAEAMAWTVALVSGVERGTEVPTWEEWEFLWKAIGGS